MNKIKKTIAGLICKYIPRNMAELEDLKDGNFLIKLGKGSILNHIGASYSQVNQILNGFVSNLFIIKYDQITVSAGDFNVEEGWGIVFNPDQVLVLYEKSIEGLKLKPDQTRIRRGIEKFIADLKQSRQKQSIDSEIQEAFDRGKWLRLCCPACGDFIQEITDYVQLKELEGKDIKCRRKQHKCHYRLNGDIINFQSSEIDIKLLLKEKKAENKT